MREVGGVYLAESSVVVGDVTIGEGSSFWPFTCARGDVAPIRVGRRVCVQDFTMLHCKHQVPLVIEDEVVIGHHVTVHCARVGARSLIGIGARVLDDCEVGESCIVAAGAVLVPGTRLPSGTVVAGVPARVIREVNDRDRAYIRDVAGRYVELAQAHARGEFPPFGIDPGPVAP
jgi:carbonic anhydrase/acetyltransferase-like protein (isoleucine patch superfamily)